MNKLLSIIFFVAIICSASHSHSGAITDSVFSGATLASLNNVTAKSSGGNPVGTIIAWPVSKNPEDMENWLECNGQAVNQAMYPELYSIIGAHVPDLRGQFLRGLGGNSGTLGTIQNYGTYVPNASTVQTLNGMSVSTMAASCDLWIPSNTGDVPPSLIGCGSAYTPGGSTTITSTQTISTGVNETRPTNMAVRYLIRALP